jgi:hypothetical protein
MAGAASQIASSLQPSQNPPAEQSLNGKFKFYYFQKYMGESNSTTRRK